MRQNENEIARQSLALFGIAGSFRRISNGLDSSYRVKTSDGRVFALRVAKSIPIRRVSAFRIEANWIDALFDNQWFCVPKLHRTENGDIIGQIQDPCGVIRASTLLSWLPGRRCYRINEAQARALGQMVGALHQHAQATITPSTDAIKSWDAKFMCAMFNKNCLHQFASEAVELVERTYLSLQRIVSTLDSNEIGLINADLGLHNVLWHQKRVSLVDFNIILWNLT